MTLGELEARIDKYERLMLEANNREDRHVFAAEFIRCIAERNAARTTADLIDLERKRGLRG